MIITQEFMDAVNNKNIRMTRIMLKDSLIVDPTFAEFEKMMEIVKENNINIYDKHDGEVLKQEQSKWTKDYMDEQMVQLIYNFSEERIKLLKNICKSLYSQKIEYIKMEREKSSNQTAISKKQVGTSLVVGGTVAAAVGVAVVKPVIIASGVAVAVVGGVLIITDK